jgi:hypothetical protein
MLIAVVHKEVRGCRSSHRITMAHQRRKYLRVEKNHGSKATCLTLSPRSSRVSSAAIFFGTAQRSLFLSRSRRLLLPEELSANISRFLLHTSAMLFAASLQTHLGQTGMSGAIFQALTSGLKHGLFSSRCFPPACEAEPWVSGFPIGCIDVIPRPLRFSVALPVLLDQLRHARSRFREPLRLSFAQIFLNVGDLAPGAKMDVGRF